jgi:YD repeat-containing protein
VVHNYTYDTRNRLTNLGVNGTVNGAAGAIAGYTYTLDPAGHRTGVTELSGRTVNYAYDNLYRLTSESIANDPNAINGVVSYNSYDSVGNRKQMTSTLAPIPAGLFNYDANDRFTAGDTYDNNGNTVSSGGVANVYDFENHLIQQGGVTIKYDGDGNRLFKTVAGVTTGAGVIPGCNPGIPGTDGNPGDRRDVFCYFVRRFERYPYWLAVLRE